MNDEKTTNEKFVEPAIRILIADDSDKVRQGLRSILEFTEDMEVVGDAVNGLKAIQQVEQLRPDLVLMDLEMPKLDGLEATQRIKERFQPTIIVMLTIHTSDSNREKAMQAGVDILEPLLVNTKRETKGKIILGTVKGDVHNLGRNLVGIMLKGAGFEVIDLGEDVPAEKFVEAVRNEGAKIVGMSALITTTMPYMRTTIQTLKEAGLLGKVKTIIGGSCVTQRYADEIGADSYAENAGAAVGKVKTLLGLK